MSPMEHHAAGDCVSGCVLRWNLIDDDQIQFKDLYSEAPEMQHPQKAHLRTEGIVKQYFYIWKTTFSEHREMKNIKMCVFYIKLSFSPTFCKNNSTRLFDCRGSYKNITNQCSIGEKSVFTFLQNVVQLTSMSPSSSSLSDPEIWFKSI